MMKFKENDIFFYILIKIFEYWLCLVLKIKLEQIKSLISRVFVV